MFDGQWGYLDHALATPSVSSQVTGVGGVHINADEPTVLDYNIDFKTPNLQATPLRARRVPVSDHDPVVVGLSLMAPLEADFADTRVGCGDGNAGLTVSHPSRFPGDTHSVSVDWGDGSVDTSVPAGPALDARAALRSWWAVHRHATVTDVHGHTYSTTAVITVEDTSSGILPPLGSGTTAKYGSTVPVKVAYHDPTAPCSTDLALVVYGDAGLDDPQQRHGDPRQGWSQVRLKTRHLPGAGTYTVTVTVPETGQTDTATLAPRR